jgi:hypothetical protein
MHLSELLFNELAEESAPSEAARAAPAGASAPPSHASHRTHGAAEAPAHARC